MDKYRDSSFDPKERMVVDTKWLLHDIPRMI